LSVRIGIHTGSVVFGPLTGNLPMDSTAIGDTANLAALRGDVGRARSLAIDILNESREAGYRHIEGLACWLMGECLAATEPAAAEGYVDRAMLISERAGARNDFAKAILTRAALRQRAGDIAAARRLLDQAYTIFQTLGTIDESARVEAALAALDRDERIPQLAGAS
jgi:hypothetical protein